MNKGQQFFDKMRNSWEQRSGHSSNASTEHKKSNWSDFHIRIVPRKIGLGL